MKLNEKLLSTPKMFKRENDIIQWGIDRNIIGDNAQGTFEGQQEKTRQEWQEWKDNHSKDDIGDIFVTLVMQCALRGTTVSTCVDECPFLEELGEYDEDLEGKSEEELLDCFISELLDFHSTFHIDIAYTIDALIYNAEKRGWALDECIEVAWDDIKDRKGLMCHGMFVKQNNLDVLEYLGISYENLSQGFKGVVYSSEHLEKVTNIFYNLGITYTAEGDYASGVVVESTGKV